MTPFCPITYLLKFKDVEGKKMSPLGLSAHWEHERLAYYEDVDYTEEIEFMQGYETSPDAIEQFLTETALQWPFK